MKNMITTILFLGLLSNANAQNFIFNWQQCLFSEGYEKSLEEQNIISIKDGYLIVFNEEIEGNPIFNYDIALVKTDTEGNFLWKKTYGGSSFDGTAGIVPSTNGNFIIAGTINSTDAGVLFPDYLPTGGIWVFMIDSLGNRLWDKVIGSSPCCLGYGANISSAPDGGVLLRYNICRDGGDVTNYFGSYDLWLVKINATGQLEWDFTLGTDWFDAGGSVAQTSDHGYLVTSQGDIGATGNMICDTSVYPFQDIGVGKIVKLDSMRNIEWMKCYYTSSYVGLYNAIEMQDGYLVAGFARTPDGDLIGCNYHEGYSHLGSLTADIWLRKIDYTGNLIWQQCYGGTNSDYPHQLFISDDENIIVIGSTQSHNGDVIGYHNGGQINCDNEDVWFLKVNGSNGEIIWNKCIGTGAAEFLGYNTPAVKIDDRNYTIAIQTTGLEPYDDRTCSNPEFEWFVWIVNITDTTSYHGTNPHVPASQNITVYPNPAVNQVVFDYTLPPTDPAALLEITDLTSKLVYSAMLKGTQGQFLLDASTLANGMYLYKITCSKVSKTGKFVVAK